MASRRRPHPRYHTVARRIECGLKPWTHNHPPTSWPATTRRGWSHQIYRIHHLHHTRWSHQIYRTITRHTTTGVKKGLLARILLATFYTSRTVCRYIATTIYKLFIETTDIRYITNVSLDVNQCNAQCPYHKKITITRVLLELNSPDEYS